MQICFRCGGRKKIYKSGNGYSWVDSGGVLTDCPMCLGVGRIKSAEEFFAENEKQIIHEGNEIPDLKIKTKIISGTAIQVSIDEKIEEEKKQETKTTTKKIIKNKNKK